jgi:glycosyltransferase 2 family protein
MKAVTTAVMIAGLLLGTAVVGAFGFTAVGRTLLAVGWPGFAVIVSYHLGVIGFLGLCWHILARGSGSALSFMWGRLIRESGAEVLPLSQVGGYIMGARAASLLGVPSATATASTVIDVTLEAFGQLGYTLLGLGIMLIIRPGNQVGVWSAFGVVIGVVAVTAFVVVQRHGLTKLEGLLGRVAPGWLGGMARHVGSLREAIDAIYRRPGAVMVAALLHFAAWVVSGIEAWVALRFMGSGLGLGPVIAMESLLYAIRSVAFVVPNAVGVQEGAYVMLAALFGLPVEAALALSLLKRARDLVIGVPALVVWQLMESRRLLARSVSTDNSAV